MGRLVAFAMPRDRGKIALLSMLLLAGCAEYAATAIEEKKRFSDTEAEVLRNAPCAMTVGAYHRRLNDAERQAIDILCDGDIIPTLNPETGLLE